MRYVSLSGAFRAACAGRARLRPAPGPPGGAGRIGPWCAFASHAIASIPFVAAHSPGATASWFDGAHRAAGLRSRMSGPVGAVGVPIRRNASGVVPSAARNTWMRWGRSQKPVSAAICVADRPVVFSRLSRSFPSSAKAANHTPATANQRKTCSASAASLDPPTQATSHFPSCR